MSFLCKLGNVAREFVELFPPKAEREPTIAEDYPEKWPEIQRKRLILKGIYIAMWAFLALLIFSRIWLGVAAIKQLQSFIWAFVPIMGFARYFAQKFECPRCRKRFHRYSRYDAVSYAKSRCQHCDLQLGESSSEKQLR